MKFREIIIKSINIEASSYTNIQDEIKSVEPLDIYLVPKKDGSHDRYVTDEEGTVSKQSIESNDTLADVVNRGKTINDTIGFGTPSTTYHLGVNTNTFNLRILNKNPLTETATGKWNMAVGDSALASLTTGQTNTAVGGWTGENLTSGNGNVFLGVQAGNKTTTGNNNVSVGYAAGYTNTTGIQNVFLGNGAGQYLSNGTSNTFLGMSSGSSHGRTTNGEWGYNTFLGYMSGTSTATTGTHGNNNVIIGAFAPLGGEVNNRLIIHSQVQRSNHSQTLPLINGDFVNRWLAIGGSFRINPIFVEQTINNSAYDSLATYSSTTGQIGKTSIEDLKNSLKRPYKVYTALLDFNQTTFDPAISVLENNLVGDIVWTRLGTGQYEGKLAEGFVRSKTWIHVGANQFGEQAYCTYSDNNTVLLKIVNLGGDTVDVGRMFGVLEIRVYQ